MRLLRFLMACAFLALSHAAAAQVAATVEGVQMSERLLALLDELEAAGGLRIAISAGVVASPEHGNDAEELLRKADEAMWRARALGQPVGVGTLPDR